MVELKQNWAKSVSQEGDMTRTRCLGKLQYSVFIPNLGSRRIYRNSKKLALKTMLAFTVTTYLMIFSSYVLSSEESEREPAVDITDISQADLGLGQTDFEYKIGAGDLLDIEVFMVEELSGESRVNSKGYVSLPLVGAIDVDSMTAEQVEREIESRLGEQYLQNPHVSVFIREFESQKITINGWVGQPGVFPLKGKTTLLQAISMAKGLVRLSDPTETVVFRNIPEKGTVGYRVNLEDIQTGVVLDPVLLAGDVVIVPKNGSRELLDETRRNMGIFLGFLPFL